MIRQHHPDDFFIAEYTLGLLEPDEVAQAHALLGRDDDAVVCALQWETRLLALTDALTPLSPPPALLGRIQATLGLPRSSAGDFEPRLIRPDTVSAAQSATPAVKPEPHVGDSADKPEPVLKATVQHAVPEAPSATPQPAPHAPVPESGRVRAAPPDPLEAFRPGADAHPPRKALWRSLWFWRTLSAALAILAAVLVLPKNTLKHDPALGASLQPPSAPAPAIVQVAIMQAPGLSSTPGWVLTVDSRQNVVLAPQVDIVVPDSESVYLWTYNEQSARPRLLGVVDPTRPLTLPMDVTGEVAPGQIFEMTQEPNVAPPREPEGPVLFIGRTVSLG